MTNENFKLNEMSGAALAYLGDAVIELMVRAKIVMTIKGNAGQLNEAAREYVTAHAQSVAVERILDKMTEAETAIYKRGRNLNGSAIPKRSSAAEYRRATGLEVLFAALYLENKNDRLRELFDFAYNFEEVMDHENI